MKQKAVRYKNLKFFYKFLVLFKFYFLNNTKTYTHIGSINLELVPDYLLSTTYTISLFTFISYKYYFLI